MKDFVLYLEHFCKSIMDWQGRVDMRYLLGGFSCVTVDGGSKTGTLEMKKSRWTSIFKRQNVQDILMNWM